MAEYKIRALFQRWKATNDPHDEAEWLLARLKASDLSMKNMELLVHLGHPAAIIALEGTMLESLEEKSVLSPESEDWGQRKLAEIVCYHSIGSALRGMLATIIFVCDFCDKEYPKSQDLTKVVMHILRDAFNLFEERADQTTADMRTLEHLRSVHSQTFLEPIPFTPQYLAQLDEKEQGMVMDFMHVFAQPAGSIPQERRPTEEAFHSAGQKVIADSTQGLCKLSLATAIEVLAAFLRKSARCEWEISRPLGLGDNNSLKEVEMLLHELHQGVRLQHQIQEASIYELFLRQAREAIVPWVLGTGDPIKGRIWTYVSP